MPSPFPGMDPYLEHHELWESVHAFLIGALAENLSSRIPPRYYVSIQQRFYVLEASELALVGIADVLVAREHASGHTQNGPRRNGVQGMPAGERSSVLTVELPEVAEVRQRFAEVRVAGTNELVTVVEVLSPVNKHPGNGRRQYEAKRLAVANSFANLVEIDVLRAGPPLPVLLNGAPLAGESLGDYRVLVSRSTERPRADLYAMAVREPLPSVSIPLRTGDDEPAVNLKALIDHVYDVGRYHLRIDYRAEPVPPLRPDDAAWADALLREKGLR